MAINYNGNYFVLVVVAGFWYLNYHNKVNAEKQYKENMSLFLLQSTKVGAKAESMINTYQEVWHDDIFNDGYTTSNGHIIKIGLIILIKLLKINGISMMCWVTIKN
jgi:hypothetical protein